MTKPHRQERDKPHLVLAKDPYVWISKITGTPVETLRERYENMTYEELRAQVEEIKERQRRRRERRR